MKLLATIALLLVMGCASKPGPNPSEYLAAWARTHCESDAYACTITAPGVNSTREGPVSVTREQWEAAQGLYNPHFEMPVTTPGILDTFPPSGDTK